MGAEGTATLVGPALDGGPAPMPGNLVRRGAELVELSERFYRTVFVSGILFVGASGAAALAMLPLRKSDATYGSVTVVLTALVVLSTPLAVRRAGDLYRLLRVQVAAQATVVALAAALVAYPLHSELWWPSCALLMLLASLVPLRRALAYCLVVLATNLAAHVVAGDLGDTPPVTIIGLWVGYGFWASAFSVLTDRLAAHLLRLNALAAPGPLLPPLRADGGARARADTAGSASAGADDAVPAGADPAPPAGAATPPAGSLRGLTARQLQVVALLADGLRYDEVGECLAITARQVQRHVANAVATLGLANANELVAVAVASRLVPDGALRDPA